MGSKIQVKVKTGSVAVSQISGKELSCGYPVEYAIKMLPKDFVVKSGKYDEISPGVEYVYEGVKALENKVGNEDKEIDWEFWYKEKEKWIKIIGKQETKHKIYRILGEPKEPFEGVASPTGGKQRPWVAVLEKSCTWADGETTESGAASKITQAIYNSGRFEYDDDAGETRYADGGELDLTKCLDRLDGGAGIFYVPTHSTLFGGQYVNCTDCACFVTTFSNAIGCTLWESEMGYGFFTNEILPIGKAVWGKPFWGGFGYHEVAWQGGATAADNVFDATLQVDDDANPTVAPHTGWIPVDIIFDDGALAPPYSDYHEKLAEPGASGVGRCIAQPTTKKRRPVK